MEQIPKRKLNQRPVRKHILELRRQLDVQRTVWRCSKLRGAFLSQSYISRQDFEKNTPSEFWTVESLLNRSVGPNLISKDFLPPARRKSVTSIKSPLPQPENGMVRNIECIVLLFVFIDDLRLCPGLATRETLAVDVLLGKSFMDRTIHSIIPTEQKVVLCHLRSAAIISKKAINSIYVCSSVFNGNTKPLKGAVSEENHLCRIAGQISIPDYTKAAVLGT